MTCVRIGNPPSQPVTEQGHGPHTSPPGQDPWAGCAGRQQGWVLSQRRGAQAASRPSGRLPGSRQNRAPRPLQERESFPYTGRPQTFPQLTLRKDLLIGREEGREFVVTPAPTPAPGCRAGISALTVARFRGCPVGGSPARSSVAGFRDLKCSCAVVWTKACSL